MMNEHQTKFVFGKILSVQKAEGGDGPRVSLLGFPQEGSGYSDEITYTVVVNHPNGGILHFTGVRPSNLRYPRPIKIMPALPGTTFHGSLVNDTTLDFQIIELPGTKACPEVPPTNPVPPITGGTT